MIEKLHEAGLKSEHAYIGGFASIGLSFLAWATSLKAEKAGTDRADRWGIFVGHWAPTFFGLGNALRTYEKPRHVEGGARAGLATGFTRGASSGTGSDTGFRGAGNPQAPANDGEAKGQVKEAS